jgi:uncharacterized membrane protein (DUF106 family)
MAILNQVSNTLTDWLLTPLAAESPWLGLMLTCLLAAALLVFLFHFSSNQHALRRARNQFVARILELLLFQHDFRINLSACNRILWANLTYLGAMFRPLLVAMVPMILIFIQLSCWFEQRPLRVGETAVFEIELDQSHPVDETIVDLTMPSIVRLDSAGVRSLATNEQAWRVRATDPGIATIEIQIDGQTELKQISVGNQLARISPVRTRASVWNSIMYPSEQPLAAAAPVSRIEVTYPERKLLLMGTEIHWAVAATLLMLIFGLILGQLFGVQVA